MSITNAELTKKLLEQKQKYKELESASQKEIQKLKRENMKLMKRLGPAYCAAMPVKANMPAPIVFPIPNITKSKSDSLL